jgi:hypothetical protein
MNLTRFSLGEDFYGWKRNAVDDEHGSPIAEQSFYSAQQEYRIPAESTAG